MILVYLIVILMAGGIIAWVTERWNKNLPRWISLITTLVSFCLLLGLWLLNPEPMRINESSWILDFNLPWIKSFGISFHLALDGLSLLLLLLTSFLGVLSVLTSWEEIQYRAGFYYFNLLWVLAGISGVFLTMDMFLFYFFWEVMLIPMYFLIVIWGHENRRYAGYKFFIFTQASGLLMLLAILSLYFIHGNITGTYTFDYFQLLGTEFSRETGRWLMFGFLAAFAVKLPVVPLHSWLPDAHSQAPTAGSLILAGLLLKTGAYGLLRFILPLFPSAAREFAPWAMLIGVVGILYGAILAFSQTDLKRLVAYTSVSHMGFVILGVFTFNEIAMQGVVMQIITHGISTGALFIIAGTLYERIHTRDLTYMGGFWRRMPFMGTIALIFAMASLGLPGLGNFIAEFLTLVGSWQASRTLTIFATIGLVGATIYSLRIVQKIFYGDMNDQAVHQSHQSSGTEQKILTDLSIREKFILVPMVIVIIWLGLFPQHVLNTSKDAISDKVLLKTTTNEPQGFLDGEKSKMKPEKTQHK
jgi:NADH-quinone oxidoreductase subunit M